MIEALLLSASILFLLILWFLLFPIRWAGGAVRSERVLDPPDGYLYSFALHLHTQFSYDSLGTPEDVMEARDRQGIDYLIVTDHENDLIGSFADGRLIAGKEVKLNDERGNLLGDLLEAGDLRIVAHPFREKYRWRLEKRRDYLFELVDLRDSFLERKGRLLLYILCTLLLYPLLGRDRLVRQFAKLVDVEGYSRRFLEEGWRSKVVGGLDHHVKLYFREVRKKILFPSYDFSLSLMRNFLLSKEPVRSREEFLKALKEGTCLISFSEKPSFVWMEGGSVRAYSPFGNTYMVVLSDKGKKWEFLGSNAEFFPEEKGSYLVIGYTYAFRIGPLLFGLRPLFVSDLLEVS